MTDAWRNAFDHGVIMTGKDGRRWLVHSGGPVRALAPVAKGKASVEDWGTPSAELVAARRSARRSERAEAMASEPQRSPLRGGVDRGLRPTLPLLEPLQRPPPRRPGPVPRG